ncbi:MAG: ImmA/IrrE family metallo-endopeptidase [Gemmatimonadetes bacterium]|nr:ImmA/IrrE family metallo-endopeptidase [Gemmatimonadota bacterium]MYB67586.1 ImmA/IrrE family metallo-endopeptidase [Gemmatimonadota bacterium]
MLITLEQIGQRLRWARESRQITQETAGAALGLQRSAISLMESGQRQVSTLELTHLADLYGRPVEWFVSPNSPVEQEDPVVALFRAEPGLQSEVVQKQARRCLHLLREGASLRRLTGGRAAVSLPRYELPSPRSVGQAIAQGQLVAEQERRRLDLGQAPVKLPETLAHQNIWTAALPLPDEISGLFLSSPDFGMAILANRTQAPVRRRFSFAHEHGHALMDRDEPATVTSAHNAKTRTEQRANAFAAAFLMPEEGVRDFLHNLGKGRGSRREEAAVDAVTEEGIQGQLRSPARSQNVTYADVALLAWHFEVSYTAAVWRLRGLNLVSQEQAQTLLDHTEEANRYLRTVKAFSDVEDSEDKAHWDHELDWQILSLALEAWWRGEISQGRLLEVGRLLDIDDETILDLAD